MLYNAPRKMARDFTKDYPHGAEADAAGKLLRDIEGREITAQNVVGRTNVGGSDSRLPEEAYDAITERLTG